MSRVSALDEMQIACDPSDPSLRFRVSSAQVASWIDRSANAYSTAAGKKGARDRQQQQTASAAASEAERKGEEAPEDERRGATAAHAATKQQTAPPSAGMAAATVSCAIRRFRHFASATAGSVNSDLSGSGGVGTDGGGHSPMGADSASPMASVARNRHHNQQHNQQQHGSPSSANASARASLLLQSGQSASVRRAAAGMHAGGQHQHQQQLLQQHTNVETIVNAVQLPSRTPVVDVEMARVWAQFPLLSARDTPLEFAFGASRLHRQVIQTVRAHPRSLGMHAPPTAGRASSIAEMQITDGVHGQRLVVPVRSTACVVGSGDHPPMCLLGIFLAAAQIGTLVRPEADLCGITTAGAPCTNGEALLCLCPHCQAPITVGSLHVDRFAERVLAVVAAAEESGTFDHNKASAADDDGGALETTRVAIDMAQFPRSIRVLPLQ